MLEQDAFFTMKGLFVVILLCIRKMHAKLLLLDLVYVRIREQKVSYT